MNKERTIIWVLVAVIVVLFGLLMWGGRRASFPEDLSDQGAPEEEIAVPEETPTSGTSKPSSQPTGSTSTGRRNVVSLLPYIGAGTASQSASATLTELSANRTRVVVTLSIPVTGVIQPVHIHNNTCSRLEGVIYPLNNLVNGRSETIINVAFNTLVFGRSPFAVATHKSLTETATITSCGDILKVLN